MVSTITSITEELAKALDLKHHQISFEDMNPICKNELQNIVTVMEDSSNLCGKIQPESLEEAASTSSSIFGLEKDTNKITQIMAEYVFCNHLNFIYKFFYRCQKVSASTIVLLGQEIFLSQEAEREFKNVSDICN